MGQDVYLQKFGIRVRNARNNANMTQTELAVKCGYSGRSTICQIENGKWNPSLETIEIMAKVLNVSASALAFGDVNTLKEEAAEDETVLAHLTVFMGLNDTGKKLTIEYAEHLYKVLRYRKR